MRRQREMAGGVSKSKNLQSRIVFVPICHKEQDRNISHLIYDKTPRQGGLVPSETCPPPKCARPSHWIPPTTGKGLPRSSEDPDPDPVGSPVERSLWGTEAE
ncbi:hypothetical protein F2P81_012972 [Scophthalmus maximus]|uniref:Uncharacterized protein n=1 Tax=Scophthalmus maximus TaxID=52904 RepID=A0A6A4SVY8_SCOMX|nr:hypothetical protein F2P81_012972 [Scophthalmus maximus]